jgi:hypothetical protein
MNLKSVAVFIGSIASFILVAIQHFGNFFRSQFKNRFNDSGRAKEARVGEYPLTLRMTSIILSV